MTPKDYGESNIYMLKNKHFGRDAMAAQKMKFSIKDFFSKCDKIRSKLRIWSHLLKKSLMANFIFCAVSELMNCAGFPHADSDTVIFC